VEISARGKVWYQEWYQNDKKYRDGGLHSECMNGDKYWYRDGKKHRDGDQPAIEYANGDKRWYKNDKLHRDGDRHAIEYNNGYKYWYQNGKIHRDGDRPAVEHADGTVRWYKRNIEYSKESLIKYYQSLEPFARYIIRKFKLMKLKRVRWIHGELLCKPPNGNYSGGRDYHKMVSYFNEL
jgi:hypothetical protein